MTQCEECGNPVLFNRGEAACSGCGLVAEFTDFDTSIPSSGIPEGSSVVNTGLQITRLLNETKDANGTNINDEARARMRRLKWLDSHTVRRKDRSVRRLFGMMNDASRKLGLSDQLRDRAFFLCKQVYAKGVLPNQEFSLLVGATIKLAAQEYGIFVSDKSLLEVLVIARERPLAQLHRAYRVTKRALAMYGMRSTPQMLFPRVAEELRLSPETRTMTRELLTEFKVYNHPEVALAAAVYVASVRTGMKLTQTAIAKSCGTSDISLRARVRKMWPEVLK